MIYCAFTLPIPDPKIDGTPNEVRVQLLPKSCWKHGSFLVSCVCACKVYRLCRTEAADRLAGRENKGYDPPEQTITYDVM
jgi:hypothetical protein